MRIAVLSGIYPPDIGGPATHACDLAAELTRRGHAVQVLTLGDGRGIERAVHGGAGGARVTRLPRRWPWPLRMAAVAAWLRRHRRDYDAVYATGLHAPAVAGARLARRPVAVKVVGDPAWERGARQGLTAASFDAFQEGGGTGDWRVGAMRALRSWWVTRADAVLVPSRSLAGVVEGWSRRPLARPVEVVPNGVRLPPATGAAADEGPVASSGRLRAAFVGRLVEHKRVDAILEAVAAVGDVQLEVVGDGPARPRLEAQAARLGVVDRVRFLGAVGHEEVLRSLRAADVAVLASSYEGLPHVAIEALAVGTPLVAPPVGGTAEVVTDGRDGLLVDPPDPARLAAALARLCDDPALRARLAQGARATGEEWRFERTADRVEGILSSLVGRGEGHRPPAVFVGKTWVADPLPADTAGKFALLARHLDVVVVAGGPGGWREAEGVRLLTLPTRRAPVLGRALFYGVAPVVGVALAAARAGAPVVCQSPYEGAVALAAARLVPRRRRPRVVVEVHGDWRTAVRLYGHRSRRVLAPLTDRLAAWAVRRADRVRAIGDHTEELARRAGYTGEIDRYLTFSDYRAFLEPPVAPLPARPRACCIAVHERYKAVDVLLDAWAEVERRLPEATLVLVGDGSQRAALEEQARRLGLGRVEFAGHVPGDEVVRILDGSTCLVLPSRAEGLGRVVLEAHARGRPVVGSAVGGIPELVEPGVTGVLVPPEDAAALADALVGVLADPDGAAAMGRRGRARAAAYDPASRYEEGVVRLARWAASSGGRRP